MAVANTVLRNAIVPPFSTRTPLMTPTGKGQVSNGSGVAYPHEKFFQSLANAANASVQIQTTIPVNSTDDGEAGTIALDANFLYYCFAANSWRRISGSVF